MLLHPSLGSRRRTMHPARLPYRDSCCRGDSRRSNSIHKGFARWPGKPTVLRRWRKHVPPSPRRLEVLVDKKQAADIRSKSKRHSYRRRMDSALADNLWLGCFRSPDRQPQRLASCRRATRILGCRRTGHPRGDKDRSSRLEVRCRQPLGLSDSRLNPERQLRRSLGRSCTS